MLGPTCSLQLETSGSLSNVGVQGNFEERQDSADPRSNVFGSLLTTFGSVEVGGRNFFKLMQQGECVLLYPGGVREVMLVTCVLLALVCGMLLH